VKFSIPLMETLSYSRAKTTPILMCFHMTSVLFGINSGRNGVKLRMTMMKVQEPDTLTFF